MAGGPPNDDGKESAKEMDQEQAVATTNPLSLDATFDALADAERRTILHYLTDAADHEATVDELVSHITQQEASHTGELPSRDSIEMRLHHIHLPKLVEVGLVEYDTRTEQLRYWSDDRLETWLERARDEVQD
ncbi:ArsR family transcriptional regulator [Natronoarchaeum mannanilyticum]|uniref:DUF7344 domain-containing protein n=1 Tax=Natronoarchaeum mannanilyticum TaxID=926360 RepID=A0AAV3TD73_9EURY